ncbi:ESX-1 secretion-associated protein [Nocardia veterana]|uniref:ESX-1 secretion-associated protein n=1 Tax=Nocardia veterana TaxID=132249 RepID=UPI000318B72C|nr:ESX-1 secretion-associated protein [Nocardia veterana]
MAGPDDPPANAMKIDPAALRSFAKTLRDESDAIAKLNSGLADAAGALPGTGWAAACTGAKDSVDNALKRIGSRVTHIADTVEQAGKIIIDTDQQLRDDLGKIGLHP